LDLPVFGLLARLSDPCTGFRRLPSSSRVNSIPAGEEIAVNQDLGIDSFLMAAPHDPIEFASQVC
jgi:hypothetical protein